MASHARNRRKPEQAEDMAGIPTILLISLLRSFGDRARAQASGKKRFFL
jgi:hypothetical protein